MIIIEKKLYHILPLHCQKIKEKVNYIRICSSLLPVVLEGHIWASIEGEIMKRMGML